MNRIDILDLLSVWWKNSREKIGANPAEPGLHALISQQYRHERERARRVSWLSSTENHDDPSRYSRVTP